MRTCYNLTSLTLGNGVVSIGDSVFRSCSLRNVTIPDSVTSIGNGAFVSCYGLTSITIGKGVTTIGDYVFEMCVSLESITVSEENENYSTLDGVLFNKNKTTLLQYPSSRCNTEYSIPNSVINVADDAFKESFYLTNVIIPDGVISIGDDAFASCGSLTSVTIGNSVTSIGAYAFYYCEELRTVNYNGTESDWNKISFKAGNSLDYATRNYFWYVTYVDENNEVIQKDMVSLDATVTLPEISDENGNEAKFYTDKAYAEEFDVATPITKNTTLYVLTSEKEPAPYTINSITLKDMAGNSLQSIPTGTFLATVSFTNVSSSADTVIILAQYTDAGAFKGLIHEQTEDVPKGSTMKLSIPVDNTSGDVAKLKAFCWESFGSLSPMGNSASFPAE